MWDRRAGPPTSAGGRGGGEEEEVEEEAEEWVEEEQQEEEGGEGAQEEAEEAEEQEDVPVFTVSCLLKPPSVGLSLLQGPYGRFRRRRRATVLVSGGLFGELPGAFWGALLKLLGSLLEASREFLGVSWGPLGRLLGPLGGFLGTSWGLLGAFLGGNLEVSVGVARPGPHMELFLRLPGPS